MSNDNDLPHSVRVFEFPELNCTMKITPAVGYLETRPITGFIRTHLSDAPTRVNMLRALIGHVAALADEIESLSPSEFVPVHAAFMPLVVKMGELSRRIAWDQPGATVQPPGS